ncbi:MAG: hypothetical protein FWD15_01735 [Alphaproteobacteria bacterium]|nr:hypothetical protein [Alphaproteobacteria bacterium]
MQFMMTDAYEQEGPVAFVFEVLSYTSVASNFAKAAGDESTQLYNYGPEGWNERGNKLVLDICNAGNNIKCEIFEKFATLVRHINEHFKATMNPKLVKAGDEPFKPIPNEFLDFVKNNNKFTKVTDAANICRIKLYTNGNQNRMRGRTSEKDRKVA